MQTAHQAQPKEEFARIQLSQLVLNPRNARKFTENFDETRSQKFNELVASVRIKGIIQPILVRPIDFETYEVIAGERRTRALQEVAKQDGKDFADVEIAAVIRDVTEDEADELMLIENAKREDLSPIEQAEGFAAFLKRRGDTPEALAELSLQTSTPIPTIRRQVNLLSLPQAVLQQWQDGNLSLGHVELLLRLSGETSILKAMTDTLSNKFSVKELKAYIENSAPTLAIAKFDRHECGTCTNNSGTQPDLFGTIEQDAKCLKPSCFQDKQGTYFAENWSKGKAKLVLGTNGFRFANRLDVSLYQDIPRTRETPLPERCAACAECVSVVQIGGKVVKERVCLGDKTCFGDIYTAPAKKAAEKKMAVAPPPVADPDFDEDNEGDEQNEGTENGETTITPKSAKSKAKSKEEGEDGEETGLDPKRSARRGQEYREKFYAQAIPAKVETMRPDSPATIRMVIAALALENSSAKNTLFAALGKAKSPGYIHNKAALVADVFSMEDQQLLPILRDMAGVVFMVADMHAPADPGARHALAQGIGISLAQEFEISEEYLNAHTKRELVAMGEEPQVALWKDPKVEAQKDKVAPKMGLMSIKKPDLVKLVIDSGATLQGRAPKEITQIVKVS